MSGPPNILINNVVDVIEIHSNTDLVLETNTQIKFNTNNLMINYIPFDEYIRKVVFDEAITTGLTNEQDVHDTLGETAGTIGTIDLTSNTSELIVDELHCSGINATTSFVNTNKIHYINISATNNIILNNLSNSNNIVYNKLDESEYSFRNYIYKIVNSTNPVVADSLTAGINSAGAYDINKLGTYVGRRIISNNISTFNVVVDDDNSGTLTEPILDVTSATAINFVTDAYNAIGSTSVGQSIFIGSSSGGISLDTFVKRMLDEEGEISFETSMSSGQNITMEITNFTGSHAIFTYDVLFRIYLHNDDDDVMLAGSPVMVVGSSPPETFIHGPVSLSSSTSTFASYMFLGLDAGNFYTIVADVTNTRTNTTINNIIIEPKNIATIQNAIIQTVTLVDETSLSVSFIGHNTYVSSWGVSTRKIVFTIKLKEGDSTYEIASSSTQNLGNVTPDQSVNNVIIPLSSIYSYGQSFIKASQNVATNTFDTDILDIRVVSNHDDTTSTFEMVTEKVSLPTFSFSAPTTPTNFTYNGTQFSWTQSTGAGTKNIYYNIFRDGHASGDTRLNTGDILNLVSTSTLSNTENSNGIISDTYSIVAYNVYGQISSHATFVVKDLSLTIASVSLTGTRKLIIYYTVTNFNGSSYSIASSSSYTPAKNNETTVLQTYITTVSSLSDSADTYHIWVEATDNYNRKSKDTGSIIVTKPTVSLSGFEFHASPRQYKATITAANLNSTSYDLVGTPTILGATYDEFSSNTIFFTFNKNIDPAIAVNTSITIRDTYGFSGSQNASFSLDVPFSSGISFTIEHDVGAVRTFTNSITGTKDADSDLTYQWNKSESASSKTGKNVTLDNSQIGDLTCVVTETNVEGFEKTYYDTLTIYVPTEVINGSFVITSETTYNEMYVDSMVLKDGSLFVKKSEIVVTTFSSFGTYSLYGTFYGSYGFTVELKIGDFDVVGPTRPDGPTLPDPSYNSIKFIIGLLGESGTLTGAAESKIYWEISGNTITTLSSSKPVTSNSEVVIDGLDSGETYIFKIINTYGDVVLESEEVSSTTLDYVYKNDALTSLTTGILAVLDDELEFVIVDIDSSTYNLKTLPKNHMSNGYFFPNLNGYFHINDEVPLYFRKRSDSSYYFPGSDNGSIAIEKSNGNDIYNLTIKKSGITYYLECDTTLAVRFVTTKTIYCDILIKPFGYTKITADWIKFDNSGSSAYHGFGTESYFLEIENGSRNDKHDLFIETSQTYQTLALRRNSNLQSYKLRFTEINKLLFYDSSANQFNIHTTYDMIDVSDTNYHKFQWFFFDSSNTTNIIPIPLNNNANIFGIFENVVINFNINATNKQFTTSHNRVLSNIVNNSNIGTVNLADIIHIRFKIFNNNYYFNINNLFGWENEDELSLGMMLANNNITNAGNIQIIISLLSIASSYSSYPSNSYKLDATRDYSGNSDDHIHVIVQLFNTYSNSVIFEAYCDNHSSIQFGTKFTRNNKYSRRSLIQRFF
jgi:hypothetical protein